MMAKTTVLQIEQGGISKLLGHENWRLKCSEQYYQHMAVFHLSILLGTWEEYLLFISILLLIYEIENCL
jgi:hypothetical protein